MKITGTWTADDDTHIWYGLAGQGTPMVLCDGIGCDGYIWPYLMDHIDERFTALRWHYRGHGNSSEPKNLAHLDIPDLVCDLHGILHHLHDTQKLTLPAILVGHSMGCQVVLEYALRHPNDVQGLVLLCGSHGRPLDTFRGTDAFKHFIDPLLRFVHRSPDRIQSFISRVVPSPLGWLASQSELNTNLVRKRDFMPYLTHIGKIRPTVFLRMLQFASEHSTLDALPDIHVPTLVMAGTRDNFTPMHLSEQIADLIPNATLGLFSEGSHTAPLEMPDFLNQQLDQWLARNNLS